MGLIMELARQKALEMKDELVRDFQEIRTNFPDNFPDDFPKIGRSGPTISSWRTSQQGEEWIKDLDIFLDHLSNNIIGPDKPSEEIIDEISIVLKGISKDGLAAEIDCTACSKEAFATYIIRDCLKNEQLPVFVATKWIEFAKGYTRLIMEV